MSKIFNLNKKNNINLDKVQNTKNVAITMLKPYLSSKHFPSPIREWKNSIYVYNKNVLNLIPYSSEWSKNLIKSYFNLYNEKIEKRIRTKRLLFRLKRLSCNKIFISNAEFKHTNNAVLINLYVFNRQKNNYLLKMKKKYIKSFLKKIKLNDKFLNKLQNIDNDLWFKLVMWNKVNLINNSAKTFNFSVTSLNISRDAYLNHQTGSGTQNKDVQHPFEALKVKEASYKLIEQMYWKTIKLISSSDKTISGRLDIDYLTKYFKYSLTKSFTKFRLYLYYRKLLYINNSKFNYSYLHILKKNLEKIYNKNVEFNIINLKRFYLNSDILTETLKLKVMKNRKKLLKYMTKIKDKIKIQNKNLSLLKNTLWSNESFEYYDNLYTVKSSFCEAPNIKKEKCITKFIVNNLKYRKVTGFRLEARGRLTRRFTASRSLFKVRYKGNLLNVESSNKNLFSVLLKGNLRSNVQLTKLSSKTRIGSFGLKGWVSGN